MKKKSIIILYFCQNDENGPSNGEDLGPKNEKNRPDFEKKELHYKPDEQNPLVGLTFLGAGHLGKFGGGIYTNCP